MSERMEPSGIKVAVPQLQEFGKDVDSIGDIPGGESDAPLQQLLSKHLSSEEELHLYGLVFATVREAVRFAVSRLNAPEHLGKRAGFHDTARFVRHISEAIAGIVVRDAIQWNHSFGYLTHDRQKIIRLTLEVFRRWEKTQSSTLNEILYSLLGSELRPAPPATHPVGMKKIAALVTEARQTRHMLGNLLAVLQARQLQDDEELPYTKKEGLRAERVMDPAVASSLLIRHQQLNRAGKIARAASALRKGDSQPLNEVRDEAENMGFFVKNYSIGQMRRRIGDRIHWLIFQGGDPDPLTDRDIVSRSDMHIHIPDDSTVRPVLPLPSSRGGDRFLMYDGKELAAYCRKHPGTLAVVEDLSVEDEVAHQGYGSVVRAAAFEYIRREINPGRRHSIQFIASEIASVVAVIFHGGERIPFLLPVTNTISKIVHVCSERYPAILGWRRKHDMVPLAGQDAVECAALELEWDVVVQDLYR